MARADLDVAIRSDATHWFRYRDGASGTVGAASKRPLYLGLAQKDYDNAQTAWGQMSARRSYDTSGFPTDYSTTNMSGDPARKTISFGSFSNRAYITDVRNGVYNAQLLDFFDSWPLTQQTYYTFWHEINSYSDFTLDDYHGAWDVIRTQFEASTANPAIHKVGGLLTADGFRKGLGLTYFDASHMFIGVDSYEYLRPPSDPPDPSFGYGTPRTTSYLWGDGVTGGVNSTASSLSLPIIVGEYGIHPYRIGDADYSLYNRPKRLQAVVDYCDNNVNPVELFCYFHSSAGVHGPWWLDCFPNYTTISDRSEADPDSVTKWQDLLASHAVYADTLAA